MKVMISLQVGSMKESAQKVKAYLEKKGIEVWICVDMQGGTDYREAIVQAIKSADAVVIMLNEKWAHSGECYDEYSFAKRLNLTSHERGITSKGQPRKPFFVPIAFSDLDWNAHNHVELLAASTNFIVHNALDLKAGDFEKTLAAVASSLAAVSQSPKAPIGKADVPTPTPTPNNTARAELRPGVIKAGNRYLGNNYADGVMTGDGAKWTQWQSWDLSITKYDPKTGDIEAHGVKKDLSKTVNGHRTPQPGMAKYLASYLTNITSCEQWYSGNFNAESGLLTLTTTKLKVTGEGTLWKLGQYVLVVFQDKIVGTHKCLEEINTGFKMGVEMLQQY